MVIFLRDTLGIRVVDEMSSSGKVEPLAVGDAPVTAPLGDDEPSTSGTAPVHRRDFVRRKMRVRNNAGKISLAHPLLAQFARQLKAEGMHSRKRRRDVVNHAAKFQLYVQSGDDDVKRNRIEMKAICDTAMVNNFFTMRERV